MGTPMNQDMCARMSEAALFLRAPNWKQPMCPSRTICSHMEASRKHDGEWKTPDTKEYTRQMACSHSQEVQKKVEEGRFLVLEVRVVVFRGCRGSKGALRVLIRSDVDLAAGSMDVLTLCTCIEWTLG